MPSLHRRSPKHLHVAIIKKRTTYKPTSTLPYKPGQIRETRNRWSTALISLRRSRTTVVTLFSNQPVQMAARGQEGKLQPALTKHGFVSVLPFSRPSPSIPRRIENTSGRRMNSRWRSRRARISNRDKGLLRGGGGGGGGEGWEGGTAGASAARR